MKQYQIFLSALLIPLDWVLFFVSLALARIVREHHDLIPRVFIPPQMMSREDLYFFGVLGATIFVLVQALTSGYTFSIRRSSLQILRELTTTLLIWFLAFITIVYLGNGYLYTVEIPRLVIVFTLVISSMLFLSVRILLRHGVLFAMRKGWITSPIAAILSKREIWEAVYYRDVLGYTISLVSEVELKKMIQARAVDLIVLPASTSSGEMTSLLRLARIYGIPVELLQVGAEFSGHASVNTDGEFPVTQITFIRISVWGRIVKRIFDIIGSILLGILLSPLILAIYLAIKFDDPRAPAIYRNRRVGKDWAHFTLYKFRYMKWELSVKDAYGVAPESDSALKYETELRATDQNSRSGPIYKITQSDPRHTRIGSIIERYSMDELPQLLNVFIGNMSLVGPRPHQPREVEHYDEWHKQVLTIKPGITGMAQVFARESPDFDHEVELDVSYIEQWNLLLDLWLLINTMRVIIIKRHG